MRYLSTMKKCCVFLLLLLTQKAFSQTNNTICITAYYAGPAQLLDSFPTQKLTHLIFSFGHLKGNQLHINNAGDTACIQKMVGLKQKNPGLKIILSLGGWGGCYTCSPVFASKKAQKEFAASVKTLTNYFKTDGIDLDWEYPAIPGHPGHPYAAADKKNFTALIRSLRKALGPSKEISFAAGGFNQFIDSSVEWKKTMRLADKVYVMSYDLVHGFSTQSGHHTPLYSTAAQQASADNAVNRMLAAGVPAHKIVPGAAFYARMFAVTDTLNNGLYRPGNFYRGISHAHLYDTLTTANGFTQYWDAIAKAPYAFNPQRKMLVTYDDSLSVTLKTKYAISKKLGGIMFWQLADDAFHNGLLDAVYNAAKKP